MIYILASIGFAYLLNRLIGDFPIIPKVPQLLTRFIVYTEERWYKAEGTPKSQSTKGIFALIFAVIVAFFLPVIFIFSLYYVYHGADWIAHTIICCQLLGMHTIQKSCEAIFKGLHFDDIQAARNAFTDFSSLDSADLTGENLIRETVLTTAEQSLRTVTAPLFFMCIGGAPLACLYTLTEIMTRRSILHPELTQFYKGARFVNKYLLALPARFSALFMIYAAYLCRLSSKEALHILRRDRGLSFNDTYTTAPLAGALQLRLGGTVSFGAVTLVRPTIGDEGETPAEGHIQKGKSMMYAASICAWIIFLILSWLWFVR